VFLYFELAKRLRRSEESSDRRGVKVFPQRADSLDNNLFDQPDEFGALGECPTEEARPPPIPVVVEFELLDLI
jgi:hypothetical protein